MKRITMTHFREQPGETIREVDRNGASFLLTKNGDPVARLVPVDEDTVVLSDGTYRGPRPLTMRRRHVG